MSSLIRSIFSAASDTSADQTLAYMSASGAAASAQAYFSAALVATTPEVRRLFTDYATQSLIGNEAIMGLMIKKGWINPYDRPETQLQSVTQQSQQMMQQQAQ